MEVTSLTVSRNRCGICRQEGHNRTRCPHDSSTAAGLAAAFRAGRRREESVRRARMLNERQQQLNERQQQLNQQARPGTSNEEWRASMYAQVVEMQRRLEALTAEQPSLPAPRTGPTIREQKVQEILFDRCQEIPEGLYKQLMDALVLRG